MVFPCADRLARCNFCCTYELEVDRMVATVKLRKQGGSLAVTLPKAVVRELGVRAGGVVHFVQTGPGEYRITPYDPETVAALKAHEKIMDEYREAFRALAD